MRHQKMISLCSETLKLAEKKKNFSEWVRAQLILENPVEVKTFSYGCLICDRLFTFKEDQGEKHMCRSSNCENFGFPIGRWIE